MTIYNIKSCHILLKYLQKHIVKNKILFKYSYYYVDVFCSKSSLILFYRYLVS